MFDILSDVLKQKRPGSLYTAARIVYICQEVLVGQAQVISFKNGNLKLAVANSMEAFRIKNNEADWLAKFNQPLKQELVKKIVFRVGE